MSLATLTDSVLRLEPSDPVALARRDLEPGEEISGDGVRTREAIPRGHKVALVDLPEGATVRKYGQPIGLASQAIAAGEHVHEHNLVSASRRGTVRAVPGGAEAVP